MTLPTDWTFKLAHCIKQAAAAPFLKPGDRFVLLCKHCCSAWCRRDCPGVRGG